VTPSSPSGHLLLEAAAATRAPLYSALALPSSSMRWLPCVRGTEAKDHRRSLCLSALRTLAMQYLSRSRHSSSPLPQRGRHSLLPFTPPPAHAKAAPDRHHRAPGSATPTSPCLTMLEPRHHKPHAEPASDDPERSTKPLPRRSPGRLLLQPAAVTLSALCPATTMTMTLPW
jgi:hypothetical protein